jgi:serine protease Do
MGFLAALGVAFAGGLVFASGFDLTNHAVARQTGATTTSAPVVPAAKSLEETSNAFVAIAEAVTPAVVSIRAERDARVVSNRPNRGRRVPSLDDFFNQFDPREVPPENASGTGFIVSSDGYILTNNHVVENFDRLSVTLNDHRVFPAKIIGHDPQTDVAVIKIDGKGLPTASLGDDTKLRIGEWVVAIGNPLGLDFTVTAGIVSAKGRGSTDLPGLLSDSYSITDFIQTDAAINPGNSGGPLVDIHGRVIGINSAIASGTGYYQGYGFAIPITLAKQVMDDLIAHGRVRRAILGVSISDVTPEDAQVAGLKNIRGVKVQSFTDETSPARKAGMEPGDVIVAVDGQPVDRVSTLQRVIRGYEPGQSVKLDVMRFGDSKTITIKLAEAPSDPTVARANLPGSSEEEVAPTGAVASEKLGVSLEVVTPEFARANGIAPDRRGVRVTEVTRGGPSADKLLVNDIITDVLHPQPRHTVRSIADLQKVLNSSDKGDIITLWVYNAAPPQVTRVINIRVGGD